MSKNYTPPTQGMFGQIFDSVLILVLVYASLMLPLLIKESDKPTELPVATAEVAKVTWESLGQNAVEQAQWVKLGYDPDKAATLINYQIFLQSLRDIAYLIFSTSVQNNQQLQL